MMFIFDIGDILGIIVIVVVIIISVYLQFNQ